MFKATANKSTCQNYCRSHGAFAHSSANCRNKKDGHNDTATLSTKMWGNLDFCYKLEWLIGSDKLKCNNITHNFSQHYRNKLQHRNSTLSDNPHAFIMISVSNHYFVEKDNHLLTNICHTSMPTTAIFLTETLSLQTLRVTFLCLLCLNMQQIQK